LAGLFFGGSLLTAGYQFNPFGSTPPKVHDALHESPVVGLKPSYRSTAGENDQSTSEQPSSSEAK